MSELLFASDRLSDQSDLVRGLEAAGHRVASRSLSAVRHEPWQPDGAVVDAVKDFFLGRDVVRALRAADEHVVIAVIVRGEHLDGVGPDWGMTTFLVEPPTTDELVARFRLALTSRVNRTEGEGLRVGDLQIDPETYQVRLRGQPLDLTFKEFQLLTFLAQRPGRVWTRGQLLQEVWGHDFFGGTRTVDVHIRRLRAKLGPEHESMIGTIRNVGYKLDARDPQEPR